jgi:hypothetical protein
MTSTHEGNAAVGAKITEISGLTDSGPKSSDFAFLF